jgi:single-stranded-DNA-specific exonuclease
MQTQWNILQPDPQLVLTIRNHLDCHPIFAKVLANRGLDAPDLIDPFISPSMADLPSPLLLADMDKAVARICRALEENEKILVIGDYDADGVTATVVVVDFLKAAGGCIAHHLPHRVTEGYGFGPPHVMQLALPQKAGLIITVDNGTASHEGVKAAGRFGIDVIITDHHNLEESLPEALAVVNPKREGHARELAELAGVGVAFYLIIALRAALRERGWWENRPEPNLKCLCDYVAIGTVADIVPLTGINRILTRSGLELMGSSVRPGVRALLQACGIQRNLVTADDIAYRLAPRINAAGRMAHANLAFELLHTSDPSRAGGLADTLNALNSRRQQSENRIYKEAITRIDSQSAQETKKTILLADSDWHEGVLGIVAAKLAARYYRPVLLLATQNGVGKGSGRSIPPVDLYAALNRCRDLLEKFGGHRMAGGLTVQADKINKLRERFESAVCEIMPSREIAPQLTIDSEIGFDEIDSRLLNDLEKLEPFGTNNPSPVFLARNVRVTSAYKVSRLHRRLVVCQDGRAETKLKAIHFNPEEDSARMTYFDQLAFRLQWNRYRGTKEIQLVVEGY